MAGADGEPTGTITPPREQDEAVHRVTEDRPGRNEVGPEALYHRIRMMILSGELAAGSALSQADLGRQLGVSRTPIREIVSRLQEQGLVQVEVSKRNRRVRVAPLSAEELDTLYASRILLESCAVAVTVTKMNDADVAELEVALNAMKAASKEGDLAAWEPSHTEFHRKLVGGVNGQMFAEITGHMDRSVRYRRFSQLVGGPLAMTGAAGQAEHEQLVEAARESDAREASRCLAHHLSRTGLVVMTELAPDSEPYLMRAALRFVGSSKSA